MQEGRRVDASGGTGGAREGIRWRDALGAFPHDVVERAALSASGHAAQILAAAAVWGAAGCTLTSQDH